MNKLIVYLVLLFTAAASYSQEVDSTTKALEIYKIGKNKSFIIKLDQRVQIPCMHLKYGYTKLVTAELTSIDGERLHFEPVNRNYRQKVCSCKSLEKIGVRTPFRVVESVLCFTYKIVHHNWYDWSEDPSKSSFRILNLKSKKWGMRIIDLPNTSRSDARK